MANSTPWLYKNVRVIVVNGPHKGQRGRAITTMGRGAWLIRFDGRYASTEVQVKHLARDPEN